VCDEANAAGCTSDVRSLVLSLFIREEDAALPVEFDEEFPNGINFFFCKK
jgi:hypothetical protein